MNVAPDTTFEAVFDAATTGLVGTVALAIFDNEGATTQPLATTAIIELGTTGVYAATRTAPAVEGQYTLIWTVDGTLAPGSVATDELVVTGNAPGDPLPPPDMYGSTDELFRRLKIRTPTPEQVTAADRILVAASGEVNKKMGRLTGLDTAELALATEVTLERGAELWNESEVPFGAIGLDNPSGPVFVSRHSRALQKLTANQESWGCA